MKFGLALLVSFFSLSAIAGSNKLLTCKYSNKSKGFALIRKSEKSMLGKEAFANKQECLSSIRASKNGIICVPEKNNQAALRRIKDSVKLGENFDSMDECQSATKKSTKNKVCGAKSYPGLKHKLYSQLEIHTGDVASSLNGQGKYQNEYATQIDLCLSGMKSIKAKRKK